MPAKRYCIACNKTGIIMLCDRCEQTYCDKHIAEHRQKLPNQLNEIMHEHELIQDELRQTTNNQSLFQTVDQWENDSIVKIQTTAQTLRDELREMITSSKQRLSTTCRDLVENLRSNRDQGAFCQHDLAQTMRQLQQLKSKVSSRLSVQLVEDKQSTIRLLTLKGSDVRHEDHEKAKVISIAKRKGTSEQQEHFSKIITGSASITHGGLLVKQTNSNSSPTYILGEQLYSKVRHTIRFRLEQCQTPYNIFLGGVSSKLTPDKIHYKSSSVAGWFHNNEVYHHGICDTNVKMHRYESSKLETSDIVSLTFDCDQKLIELYPERTKKIHELPIDTAKMPFPWQILIILSHENDAVKILYNA